MIRGVLVADHAAYRARVRAVIAAHTDLAVVEEAKQGGNALELVITLHLAVILMQALMPVVNGVATTRRIQAACPTVQSVLVPSFFTDDVMEGGRAGAIGYLRAVADAEEFVLTIRAAHQGHARHPPFPLQAYRYTGSQPLRVTTRRTLCLPSRCAASRRHWFHALMDARCMRKREALPIQ